MKSSKTEDAMCLLGGALLGAAAMYLLDPQQGQRRRQRIGQAAENAWDATSDAVATGWDRLRDQASDLADHLHDHADSLASGASSYARKGSSYSSDAVGRAGDVAARLRDRAAELKDKIADYASKYSAAGADWAQSARGSIGSAYDDASDMAADAVDEGRDYAASTHHSLSDWGSRLFNRAKDWGSSLSDQASSIRDRAMDYYTSSRDAAKNARKYASRSASHFRKGIAGEPEGFGTGSVVGTAVTCVVVGGAVMYLMDPQRGRGRRAKLADQTASFLRRTGRTMRATGVHFSNKLRGATYEARKSMGFGQQQSGGSSELANRVRFQVMQLVAHPSFVSFSADADGTVTLSGPIDREEAETLLAAINRIPGCVQIINRLETREHLTDREVDEYNRQQAMPQM